MTLEEHLKNTFDKLDSTEIAKISEKMLNETTTIVLQRYQKPILSIIKHAKDFDATMIAFYQAVKDLEESQKKTVLSVDETRHILVESGLPTQQLRSH